MRHAAIFGLVVALCAALPCLHPRASHVIAPRQLDVRAEFAGPAQAWALDWQPARDGPRTGYWIDAATAGEDRILKRNFRLPWYEIEDVRLTLRDERPGAIRPTIQVGCRDGLVQSRLTKVALRAGDGTTPDAEGRFSLSPAASLDLDLPAPPWWHGWPLRLALTALVGALTFVLAAASWAGVTWWDRRRAPLPHRLNVSPSPRLIPLLTWSLALAVPLWFAAWTPVLMEGDGTAFVMVGHLIWNDLTFAHFDGWRLPGYGVFIAPFTALLWDYGTGIGVAQALLGIATAIFAWDMLRRRVSHGWALAGLLLVAADPMLLVWQRYILSETLAAFQVTLLVWLLDRTLTGAVTRTRTAVGTLAVAALSIFAIYTRANFQTFLIVLPVAFIVAHALAGRARRGVAAAAVYVTLVALALYPAFAHNQRQHGRASLLVGADVNRAVFSWQNNAVDVNQTAAFTLPELRELLAHMDTGGFWELAFTAYLERSPTIPAPPGLSTQAVMNHRSGVVVRESLARQPDLYVQRIAQGFISVLGVPVPTPWYYGHSTANMARVFRGYPAKRYTTNLFHEVPVSTRTRWATVARHARDISDAHKNPNTKVFRGLFAAFWWGRPLIVLAFLGGALRAVIRRDVPMAAAALLVGGNAAAIALVQYTGLDRYGTPFFSLMTMVAIFFLARPKSQIHTTFAQPHSGFDHPATTVA